MAPPLSAASMQSRDSPCQASRPLPSQPVAKVESTELQWLSPSRTGSRPVLGAAAVQILRVASGVEHGAADVPESLLGADHGDARQLALDNAQDSDEAKEHHRRRAHHHVQADHDPDLCWEPRAPKERLGASPEA